ncbi:TetR/AcrR family transcriptional regulator [Paeniglutamicibacter antarcticus]|uniref:TetR/AcrR family transcriptional regulator n=1 Tax=Paeniglutamicibacter antarcticus TaxID=494023 RepID=A0ABP9TJQ3_9MICC
MARVIKERADTIAQLAATFRTYGFNGASLSVISESTSLGKGSLYNFFPGGKDEMAEAVLDEVSDWFRLHINEPLAAAGNPAARIEAMFTSCEEYFSSHQLVCLFGAFALSHEQKRFEAQIFRYFDDWAAALTTALQDGGWPRQEANALALDIIAGIQGALVIARARHNPCTLNALLMRLRLTIAFESRAPFPTESRTLS